MKISIITMIGIILALLSGIIAFLGGIFRLGSLYLAIPLLIPTSFYSLHPYMIVFAFFTLLIILERFVGMGNLPNRPKFLTDIPIIFAEMASISFILSVFTSTNYSLYEFFMKSAYILEFLATIWFISSQLWLYKSYPSTRPPVLLAIYAFILLGALLLGFIFNLSMFHEYIYMVLYLAILILGERLDLAQIGIRRSMHISIRLFLLLGILFLISIIVNLFFPQMLNNQIILIILTLFVLLLFYMYKLTNTSLGSFLFLGTFVLFGANLDLFFSQLLIFQITLIILVFFVMLLLRYDIVIFRTPEETSMSFYLRWSLRGGYTWLLIGIILMELYTFSNSSYYLYDSALHSIALGFIMTMVFSHAPIVFPSMIKMPFIEKFRGNLYWVIAFWIVLLIRIIGDLITMFVRLNVVTTLIGVSGFLVIPILIGFLFSIIEAIIKNNRKTYSTI